MYVVVKYEKHTGYKYIADVVETYDDLLNYVAVLKADDVTLKQIHEVIHENPPISYDIKLLEGGMYIYKYQRYEFVKTPSYRPLAMYSSQE